MKYTFDIVNIYTKEILNQVTFIAPDYSHALEIVKDILLALKPTEHENYTIHPLN